MNLVVYYGFKGINTDEPVFYCFDCIVNDKDDELECNIDDDDELDYQIRIRHSTNKISFDGVECGTDGKLTIDLETYMSLVIPDC